LDHKTGNLFTVVTLSKIRTK